MANEARIKLSVETKQAQQDIRLIDKQIHELGTGSTIDLNPDEKDISSKTKGKSLVAEQIKMTKALEKYISTTQEFNGKLLSKLDAIEKALSLESTEVSDTATSKSEKPSQPVQPTQPNQTPQTPKQDSNQLSQILKKLATGATIATAVNSLINYAKSGASDSMNTEFTAYQVYGPIGKYSGEYDEGRDNSAELGIPYGYKTNDTLSAQKMLVSGTGDATNEDTTSLLRTSRTLVLNEGNYTRAYNSAYQTGAFKSGDLQKFSNMFASSLQASGMFGRQDEQLEILNQISNLLDDNLTEVTENQYKNTVGLYSLFSNSSQAMSGTSAMTLANGLNTALTSENPSVDLALGKWSGRYSSLWEYERAKEQGIANPENLKNFLTSFESYNGISSLESDEAKYAFQRYMKSLGVDLNTTQIETIAQNEKEIKNGNYTLDTSTGEDIINEKESNYNDSKLSELLEYEARKQSVQEKVGDDVNEIKEYWAKFYDNLPEWLQGGLSLGGSATSGLANFGVSALSGYLGTKLFGKIFGNGTSTVSNSGILGKIFGGTKASKAAETVLNSTDEVAEGAGKMATGMSGATKALQGVAKWAPWVSAGIEAVSTGVEVSKDLKNDDTREAVNDVGSGIGSIGGGFGGAWAGGKAGALIGSAIAPGVGTAIGGGVGAIAGAILGDAAGDYIGGKAGDAIYTTTSGRGYDITEEQFANLSKYYDNVSKLYETKGNDPAQKYTNNTVVPYLKSIGVSESVYKGYKWDVGKPDFMIDFEKGKYNVESYAIGNDYVPYDGLPAILHKGEAVLNAHDAKEWRSSMTSDYSGGVSTLEIKVSGSIEGLTQDNQNKITTEIVKQINLYMKDRSMLRQLSSNSKRVFI